jgi:hypothetical protein
VRLEDAAVRIRPRGGWEALDLGFQMARDNWRALWAIWLAVYLPAAALLHLLFREHLWIAGLGLWWMKPLFDRFLLHVVSRAVFGAPPGVRTTLGAWREILRRGVPGSLTLQRFDLARSFILPVWQLEQQKGRAARERRNALGKRMRGYAVWLTVVCSNFEAMAMLSIVFAVALLVPAGADPGFEFSSFFSGRSEEEAAVWGWVDSLAYGAAMTLIEPFYVAAGFSLYLNRRAVLEGWDIEIALRRLEARLESAPRPASAGVLAMLVAAALAIGGALLPDTPAHAAEKQARTEIREVLKAREFQTWHEEMTRGLRSERKEQEDDSPSDMSLWRRIGRWMARLAQGIAWLAAAAIAVWLLAKLVRALRDRAPRESAPAWRPPEALFGLALEPGTLPDDVAAAAAELARAGRLREALSLLYRGALSVLVHRDRVPLREADTEGDCLRAARRTLAAEAAAYFGRLVAAWSAGAYAGRLPDLAEAEALAGEWAAHFGARAEAAA